MKKIIKQNTEPQTPVTPGQSDALAESRPKSSLKGLRLGFYPAKRPANEYSVKYW